MTDRAPWRPGATNGCPTGKVAFKSRAEAKRESVRLRSRYGWHLRPYQCARGCGEQIWHLAHLHPRVLSGEFSSQEWYSRPQSAS